MPLSCSIHILPFTCTTQPTAGRSSLWWPWDDSQSFLRHPDSSKKRKHKNRRPSKTRELQSSCEAPDRRPHLLLPLRQRSRGQDWLIRMPVMLPPEPSYKETKLLGTKLDTKNDIIARKNKMWQPIQKFSNFFRSKRLSVTHKIRIFRAYVETTLLYNSETWALTPTLENSLDQFPS